jgi:hypothetical protein
MSNPVLVRAIELHEDAPEFREKLEAIRARLDTISGGRAIWKVAPGESAIAWDECRDNQCIVVGWEHIGDFRQYKSEKDVKQALGVPDDEFSRDAKSIWRFLAKVAVGDVVVANKGRTTVVGIGVVCGATGTGSRGGRILRESDQEADSSHTMASIAE